MRRVALILFGLFFGMTFFACQEKQESIRVGNPAPVDTPKPNVNKVNQFDLVHINQATIE